MRLRSFRSGFDFSLRCVGFAEGNIVADASAK
jgi:hypothetical protein